MAYRSAHCRGEGAQRCGLTLPTSGPSPAGFAVLHGPLKSNVRHRDSQICSVAAALNTRTQLSLYVPQSLSAELEALRRLLDPIQAHLIPAHVTLCREHELANLAPAVIRSRLAAAEARHITLRFGRPESFHEHGILLPCIEGEAEFQELRWWLLGSREVRRQVPHITLAHPRNPRSPGNSLFTAGFLEGNLIITFACVRRIQQEGSEPWQVLEQYALGSTERGDA